MGKSKKAKETLADKKKKEVKETVVEEKTQKAPEAPTTTASPKPTEEPAKVEEPMVTEVKAEEKPKEEPAKELKTDEKTKIASTSKKVDMTKKVDLNKKKNEVLTPEVVEPDSKVPAKATLNTTVGAIVSGSDPKDRIDKNHAIDLMTMIHQEYVTNPSATGKIAQAAKRQFDVMSAVALTQYFTQLEADFQSMGVRIKPQMRQQAEEVLNQYLGITTTVTQLEDGQLLLEFQEVPDDLRKAVKADKKVENKPIPEPNPEMPEKDKLETLSAIFNNKGEGGIGSNMLKGLEWARKAFSFDENEKKSVILANILNKPFDTTMRNCLRGMVGGKLNTEHCLFGAHALMKSWCPQLSEQEVAEIVSVLASCAIEKKVFDWNQNAKVTQKATIDGELEAVTTKLLATQSSKMIDAILENKDEAAIEYAKHLSVVVHPATVRKTLMAVYGDSNSILKDKLEEIAKYYVRPIAKLANYVDKSAYSEK